MSTSSKKRRHLSKSKRRELRVRQAKRAWQTRWQLQRQYDNLPQQARDFLGGFAGAMGWPTFLRFTVVLIATILTVGRRTTSNLLRTVGLLAPGDPSSYHRLFSHRKWSSAALARFLAGWIFNHLVGDGPIELASDDTTDEHPGDSVYGKACHRDAVRSSHSFTAYRWGHKWLVVAVLVRLPFTSRRWALPILVVLCHSRKEDEQAGRRHKTPAVLLRQLLLLLRRWFPQRTFVCCADGGFASHELARFAGKNSSWLSLVSRFYANAALYEPAPVLPPGAKKPNGRPRVKGKKLDNPKQAVAKAAEGERQRLRLCWYGGSEQEVEAVSGTGHWYQAGYSLVEVRWVYVKVLKAKPREEYFFSTAVGLSVKEILETYALRWNIETTFEEMRSYLGLESTCGRKKETVLRAAPCLFGLYSVITCLYLLMPEEYKRGGIHWRGKDQVTFSDAITCVRRWLWAEWVFPLAGHRQAFENLPEQVRDLILGGLAPAA